MTTLEKMQADNPWMVVYKTKSGFAGIPKAMIARQKVNEEQVLQIIKLQKKRNSLCVKIEAAMSDPPICDALLEKWTENEYKLQDLWGFDRDSRYHKFWEIPSCQCPKMDNDDAYPTGYYTISGACKLHGRHLK